jgi:branched-chain amino acid transport system substrate-binding protein
LLCQKHVNAKGGVLGRPIEFMIYDDGSDEKTAVGLYERLIASDAEPDLTGPAPLSPRAQAQGFSHSSV